MLLQMLIAHPQMLGTVLKSTPTWVWGLLATLIWLGLSQARDRSASLARITIMPIAMTGLSLWGTIAAFGNSPLFAYVMLAWMLTAAVMLAVITPMAVPRGTSFDAQTRTYTMRGSLIPLVLILGIFLTKYVVGVELAIKPTLAQDGQYSLIVGALYGLFSGIFTGRTARLLLLARRRGDFSSPALNA